MKIGPHDKIVFTLYFKLCYLVSKSGPTLLPPHGLQPFRLLCPWDFSAKVWNELPLPSLGDLPQLGIKPASRALGGRFSTTEPPGKPHILNYRKELQKKYIAFQFVTEHYFDHTENIHNLSFTFLCRELPIYVPHRNNEHILWNTHLK